MLARIQRYLVLACLLVALGWAAIAIEAGAWLWSAGGFLLLVVCYLVTLATEFLLLYKFSFRSVLSRPGVPQLVVAYFRELPCCIAAFLWRQPFRSNTIEDSAGGFLTDRRGVVLVHGLFCNRGFWNPWLRRLRDQGIPFIAVNLEPLHGSIDAYVPHIERAVARMTKATGLPPVLVGHSMGGLAIRAWFARPGNVAAVCRVITIGTPHQGTLLADHSRLVNGKQMRRGSSWLAELRKKERGAPVARFTCFWSECDNIVFPTGSATLPGADNRQLAGMPHMAMAFHPAVFDETLRQLEVCQGGRSAIRSA